MTWPQNVGLASHRGVKQANQSALIADQAPLKALHTSRGTTVSSEQATSGMADTTQRERQHAAPHSGGALLILSARDSIAKITGQSLQWTSGETLTLGRGTYRGADGYQRYRSILDQYHDAILVIDEAERLAGQLDNQIIQQHMNPSPQSLEQQSGG